MRERAAGMIVWRLVRELAERCRRRRAQARLVRIRRGLGLAWVAAAVVAGGGCASPGGRVAYSAAERRAVGHAIVGQSLDVVSTSMALEDEKLAEGNSIWWNPEDAGSILAGKVALMGAGWLLGEWQPTWRRAIWTTLGVAGYGAASWNTYKMIEADANPWK